MCSFYSLQRNLCSSPSRVKKLKNKNKIIIIIIKVQIFYLLKNVNLKFKKNNSNISIIRLASSEGQHWPLLHACIVPKGDIGYCHMLVGECLA
jgi:hypothetical protein